MPKTTARASRLVKTVYRNQDSVKTTSEVAFTSAPMDELFAAASTERPLQGDSLEDIGPGPLSDASRIVDGQTPHNASSAATTPHPPPSRVRSLSQDSQVVPPQDSESPDLVQFVIDAVDTSVWARAPVGPPRRNMPIPISDDESSEIGDHTRGQRSDVGTRQSQEFMTPASVQTHTQTWTAAQLAGTPQMVAVQANPPAQEPIQDDRKRGCLYCCFK
ncbi:hypothetical protein PAXRUDRAFT_824519 [Paxillus rubicundulus Ve08.2h10]|uniref:Uncharacterized protein n=1 Tax=Paxillus rubicundulus Ve08.2h10 TaxID=930991 RepID=A0A0D0DHT0_9AGAM|nr:hypothetical protein PAXRUDRAFT_824519 [Paxillus rubicundulus Ve08.2h10]